MPSTKTPDADVATLLAGAGLGLVVGVNLFRGPMRPAVAGVPTKAVFVAETGGPPPVPYIDAAANGDTWTFEIQVMVRGDRESFAAARTLARSIRDALHRASISGYLSCVALQSGPTSVGFDGNECPLFSVNARLVACE